MCLGELLNETVPNEGTFWKVFFRRPSEKLEFTFCTMNGDKTAEQNKWLTAEATKWQAGGRCGDGILMDVRVYDEIRSYPSGFHGFTTMWEAEQYCRCVVSGYPHRYTDKEIIECSYRTPVAVGRQYGLKVIVAREIFIPAAEIAAT